MRSFAFLVHPLTLGQLKDFWPAAKLVPGFILKPSLSKFPPFFKVFKIQKIASIQKKEIQGYLIALSLLPSQIATADEAFLADKVIEAASIAKKLGAKILGITGFQSISNDNWQAIYRETKIPITSGSAFTAWTIFESAYLAAHKKDKQLSDLTVTVIDAQTPVGSLCVRKFAEYVKRVVITCSDKKEAARLKEVSSGIGRAEIVQAEAPHLAVSGADIIILSDCMPDYCIEFKEFKPGAIVCDVSASRRLSKLAGKRNDLVLVRSGLVKLPNHSEIPIKTGLPKNIIPAALAETMLLTFEGKFVNYSLGNNINLDKLEEIADIAVRHGFEVLPT